MTDKKKEPTKFSKAKAAAMEARRGKVSEAILEGDTYREMAKKFGVSPATIMTDVKAVLGEWRSERIEAVGDMIAVQHRLLDDIQKVLRPLVSQGGAAQVLGKTDKDGNPIILSLPDLGSIDRMLALQDRRMKLYGLDSKAMMEHIKQFLEEHDPERLASEGQSIANGLREIETILERHRGRDSSKKSNPGDPGPPTLN